MARRTTLALALLLALAAVAGAQAELKPNQPLENPRSILVKSLVDEACDVIAEQGELAFTDFRIKDSKWRQGEIYIFILTMDGYSVVNPPNRKLEHKNLLDLMDTGFRPVVRWMLREVSSPQGEGWVHYMWPKPDHKQPSPKSTFVKKATSPAGFDYIVGCGAYNLEMEPAFIVEQVRDAANLLRMRGQDAFDLIRDNTGEFLFRDTYIFVTDEQGTEIVNPAFPILEGKNLMDMKDVDGSYIVRNYILVAKKQGEGWVKYRWIKPGANEPTLKNTFVKGVKLGDEFFVIGSGIYQR